MRTSKIEGTSVGEKIRARERPSGREKCGGDGTKGGGAGGSAVPDAAKPAEGTGGGHPYAAADDTEKTKGLPLYGSPEMLRGKTVGTAEEEFRFLDGKPQEEHGQAVKTETEAAVRRAAVTEELEVERNVI